jgi:flavin reductase (DIM6/NTAB) family NADH-FMN oxidoreductase RutF
VIAARDFRAAFSAVPMPVSVVTAPGEHVHATTVSSFCSLSVAPPLALVALDRGSDTLAAARRAQRFAINVLAAGQESLARRCATKGACKLEPEEWREEDELPVLTDAAVWLACELSDVHPGGDHLILVGAVSSVRVGEGEPILYHRRDFGVPHGHAGPQRPARDP